MHSVLIVEDDPSLQELYELALKKSFLIKGIASDGEEAVEMYRAFDEKPDIMIIDYRMPKKNGIDAMRGILQIDHDAKIIIVSGDASVESTAIRLGATAFIAKPFHVHILVREIDDILDDGER